jgi:hypothetical protein
MKKILVAFLLLSFIFMSCGRGLTPYQAAGMKGKCGSRNYIR